MNKHENARARRGQSLIEYVALTALVAIVSIGTVKVFGGKVRSRLNQITTAFDRNVQQGLRSKRSTSTGDDEDDDSTDDGDVKLPKGIRLPGGVKLPHVLGG